MAGSRKKDTGRKPTVKSVKKPPVPRHTKSHVWFGFFPSGKRITEVEIKHHEATKMARQLCMDERRGVTIYINGRADRMYRYHKDGPVMTRF